MTTSLRPDVLPDPQRYYTPLISISIGLGITASLAAAITVASLPEPALQPLAIAAPPLVGAAPTPSAHSTEREAAPPRSNELRWVFRAGGDQYVTLLELGNQRATADRFPAHAKPRLVTGEIETASIARVTANDVPAEQLRMTSVKLDTGCVADVRDYAIVARLVGDPGYAGDIKAWTADNVMSAGVIVLAARITGCGDATFGHDADAPMLVQLTDEKQSEDLALAARSALLASDVARDTQREWQTNGGEGEWHEHAAIATRFVRHPKTKVLWAITHGNVEEVGCGGPRANVLSVAKVGKGGALEAIEVRRLESLHSLTHVIDVHGDSTPELVGKDWLGLSSLVVTAAEKPVLSHHMAFFGCPC